MSIIYDALKKTQQQRGNDTIEAKKNFRPKIKLLVKCLSGVLVVASAIYFSLSHLTLWKASKHTTAHNESLILNGVFLSDNNKMAMINQQLYALGDSVQGMKIIEINEHNIKIRYENTVEVLNILGV